MRQPTSTFCFHLENNLHFPPLFLSSAKLMLEDQSGIFIPSRAQCALLSSSALIRFITCCFCGSIILSIHLLVYPQTGSHKSLELISDRIKYLLNYEDYEKCMICPIKRNAVQCNSSMLSQKGFDGYKILCELSMFLERSFSPSELAFNFYSQNEI